MARSASCCCNNGLHIDILIDRDHPVPKLHPAGIRDVQIESAVTTIMDCEDSVAAVDAQDKGSGLFELARAMRGQPVGAFLQARPAGRTCAQPDRDYHFARWQLEPAGRSLMLVRNVGHLMTNDAILDRCRAEMPRASWTRC